MINFIIESFNNLTFENKLSLIKTSIELFIKPLFKILKSQINIKLLVVKLKSKYAKNSWKAMREEGKIQRMKMAEVIKNYKPNAPFYVYANEHAMLYNIIFNKSLKELKIERNVPSNKSLEEHLTKKELKVINELEKYNSELLMANITYDNRKTILKIHHDNLRNED
jgi:hypothetical protein